MIRVPRLHGARRAFTRGARRRAFAALACLSLTSAAGCEFDEITVAPGRSRPVVHAILNPFGGREYTLLLERTLSGRIATRDSAFDPDDPIVSGEGEPITGAVVLIFNEFGDSAIGLEDVEARDDGKGRGVYRFINAARGIMAEPLPHAINIVRGQRYRLRVHLSDGTSITAATTTPVAVIRPDTAPTRIFDREGEPYTFMWPSSEKTKRYAVQVQTPYGPFELFSADTSIALTGALRNIFAERFAHVFMPGFLQDLQVLAVDTNYFDYYRSANDPFTGSGLLSHLDGATGVFGSAVPIRGTRVEVVAPVDEPGEGTWQPADDTSPYPTRLTIYYTGNVASGRVDDRDEIPFRRGVLGVRGGTRAAPRLTLAVLAAQSARDTAYVLTAEIVGERLVTDRGDGAAPRLWERVPGPTP